MGAVFVPSGGGLLKQFSPDMKAKCPDCNQETRTRICPQCHFELTQSAGSSREKIIAVIGGRSTGKSNYIATLIYRLEHEVGANFSGALRAMGDTTRERYRRDFFDPLFKDKRVIKPTPSTIQERGVRTPLIFRMTTDIGKNPQSANLVLFDTAGEDMQSLDTLSTEARYICFADAIIFLIDPLQIDAVRQQLPANVLPKAEIASEPSYIVGRLRDLFERQFQMRPNDKIDTPIAFAVSKLDAIFPIIDASSGLHHAGDHLGFFNENDAQSVNTELSAYLSEWVGTNFEQLLRHNFASYRFFGVSSLGKAPTPDGQIDGAVSPMRVEDPLLWIFSQFKLIKTKK